MQPMPFKYKTLYELKQDAAQKKQDIPFGNNDAVLNDAIDVGECRVFNRFVAQPLEGNSALPSGAPSAATKDWYRKLAEGGWGMIWIESTSVSADGRSGAAQLYLNEETADAFGELVRAIRAASPLPYVYLVLQLTHSGRSSKIDGEPAPVAVCPNPYLEKDGERIISDEELSDLEDDFVNTALLAQKAGFDAVDIRACHGYLIDSLLGAHTRTGNYGGTFENRNRFILNVVEKIRMASSIQIGARISFYEGLPWPYGWGTAEEEPAESDTSEPIRLIRELYLRGVRLFNTSAGIGISTPYLIRPYDRGPITSPEHQLQGVARQLNFARLAKKAAPEAVVVASALSWLREYALDVAAGGIEDGWFDMAGFGRLSLSTPGFPLLVKNAAENLRRKLCTTCSGCSTLVKSGKPIYCLIQNNGKKSGGFDGI